MSSDSAWMLALQRKGPAHTNPEARYTDRGQRTQELPSVRHNHTLCILRAIVDIAVYSKQRRIERIVKDDESSIRSDTRD